jgi:hypothetical protein
MAAQAVIENYAVNNIVRQSEKARKLSFAGFRILWLPDLDSNQGPAD